MTASAPEPDPTLLIIAKQPVPGRVKTRLTPPFTHEQAAALAEAALADSLHTMLMTPLGGGSWSSTASRVPGCHPGSKSCHSAGARSTSAWPTPLPPFMAAHC